MQYLSSKQFNKIISVYLTDTSKDTMNAVVKALAANHMARVKEDLANGKFKELSKAAKKLKEAREKSPAEDVVMKSPEQEQRALIKAAE